MKMILIKEDTFDAICKNHLQISSLANYSVSPNWQDKEQTPENLEKYFQERMQQLTERLKAAL